MKEWKKVKLGDCIKEVVEKTTENNQYKVLSVTKDGIFSQEDFFKKQIASENNIGYKVIRKNNLVFSTMNLWMGSLDVLTNYDIGIVSPAYKIFKFNEDLMLPSYGKYFMKSYYMLEQYKNCSEQGASIVRRNLDLKALLNISINVPLISKQEKIVKILETADLIINKYKILLKEKEQFIKSQFIEMFKEEFNKSRKKLAEFTSIITKGTTPTTVGFDFIDDGINFIKIESLSNDKKINKEKCLHISSECNKKLSRSQLEKDDILFSIAGTMGMIAKVTEDILPANTNQALAIIRLKENTNINVDFLIELLRSSFITSQIESNKRGIAQFNLSLEDLKKLEIILPSIEKQKYFSNIAQLIDNQKLKLKKIIKYYENLKKGLIQQLLIGKTKVKI